MVSLNQWFLKGVEYHTSVAGEEVVERMKDNQRNI